MQGMQATVYIVLLTVSILSTFFSTILGVSVSRNAVLDVVVRFIMLHM